MSDQAAPDTQAPEPVSTDTSTAPETPAVDNAALMTRMDELAQSVQALTPQQEADNRSLVDLTAEPFDPYTGTGIDPEGEYDGEGDTQPPDLQQLSQFIDQQVQQALNPMLEQQRVTSIRNEAIALEQKYPELSKPEIAGPVVQDAQRFAQTIGFANNLSPDQVGRLAQSPALIEKLYLAQRAGQQAQQETPADATSNVQLEGSAAQVTQGEDDVYDRMNALGPSQDGFRWA